MNAKEAHEQFENELFNERSGCLYNHREKGLTHGVWLRFCALRALLAVGENATAEEYEAAFEAEQAASTP